MRDVISLEKERNERRPYPNQNRAQKVLYGLGKWFGNAELSTGLISIDELRERKPYEVRRRGAAVTTAAALVVSGLFAISKLDRSDNESSTNSQTDTAIDCVFEYDQKPYEFKPEAGQGWQHAMTEMDNVTESNECFAQTEQYLRDRYGEPLVGETYYIPTGVEVEWSVSS